jgi:hypothetical protein
VDSTAENAPGQDAVTDAEIDARLAERGPVPYPGIWHAPPFTDRTVHDVRYAVVAFDLGLSALGVRRDDGTLWIVPADGEPDQVNSSLDAFVACTRAYEQSRAEADAYEGPDDDSDEADDLAEQAADALTDALLERLAEIDAVAVAEENSFWSVAAEELGYGMSA